MKRCLALLLTLLTLLSAGLLGSLTAQAYTVRKTKPSGKDPHYYSGANPFYAGGYLNECTWYAWGRAYEALGAKPDLSTAAAHNWYQYNKSQKAYSYGSKPKAGAIMITVKDGSHGHAAFVEELYGNGTMLISEYNYNVRNGFSTQVIRQLSAGEKRGRAHKVVGYIYVVDEKAADTTAPTISELKATKKNAKGFRLSAKASDKTGVTAVKFQVRTEEQKWQDAVWLDGTRASKDDCWTCKVSVSAFDNSLGQYVVRCCAYDEAGNKATKELTVTIADKASDNAAAERQISAADLSGLTPVLFPALAAGQKSGDASAENDLWERRFPASGDERAPAAASSNWTAADADQPADAACSDWFRTMFTSNDLFDFARASVQDTCA